MYFWAILRVAVFSYPVGGQVFPKVWHLVATIGVIGVDLWMWLDRFVCELIAPIREPFAVNGRQQIVNIGVIVSIWRSCCGQSPWINAFKSVGTARERWKVNGGR